MSFWKISSFLIVKFQERFARCKERDDLVFIWNDKKNGFCQHIQTIQITCKERDEILWYLILFSMLVGIISPWYFWISIFYSDSQLILIQNRNARGCVCTGRATVWTSALWRKREIKSFCNHLLNFRARLVFHAIMSRKCVCVTVSDSHSRNPTVLCWFFRCYCESVQCICISSINTGFVTIKCNRRMRATCIQYAMMLLLSVFSLACVHKTATNEQYWRHQRRQPKYAHFNIEHSRFCFAKKRFLVDRNDNLADWVCEARAKAQRWKVRYRFFSRHEQRTRSTANDSSSIPSEQNWEQLK